MTFKHIHNIVNYKLSLSIVRVTSELEPMPADLGQVAVCMPDSLQ